MAIRRPLYYDSGNLREMTDEQIEKIKARMFWSYVNNPSVVLTVVNSGGNLGTITDTRLQAGAASTSASAFPDEGTTAEPSIVNMGISRLQQTVATDPNPTTTTTQYPAYYTAAGQVRAMNLQDMYDTFAEDVFAGGWGLMPDSSGPYPSLVNFFIYTVSTSNSLADYTAVPGPDGSTIIPIFTDTRADAAAYSAGGIPEAADQPTTIQDYYLHKRNTQSIAIDDMAKLKTNGNVEVMTTGAVDVAIGAAIRYMVQSENGRMIRYAYGVNGSGTGTVCGTAMTDTRLDGAGNYQTLFVGADDYRSQEFPDGSQQVINVYTLKSRVE